MTRWLCSNKSSHNRLPRSLSSLVWLGVAAIWLAASGPAGANFIPPQNTGRPGNREGAATRGECGITDPEQKLTALVPISNLGLTMAAQPTFAWFTPRSTYKYQQFRLFQVRGNAETLIYEQTIATGAHSEAAQPGIHQLQLPAEITLQPQQDYRWDISLLCDRQDPNNLTFAGGWVQRVLPPSSLLNVLQPNQPNSQRSEQYAQAGLWYDALGELLRSPKQPTSDPAIRTQWSALMRSEAVGLLWLAGQFPQSSTRQHQNFARPAPRWEKSPRP